MAKREEDYLHRSGTSGHGTNAASHASREEIPQYTTLLGNEGAEQQLEGTELSRGRPDQQQTREVEDLDKRPILASMDETREFLEERVDRRESTCRARLADLDTARLEMISLLESINPACGDDTWLRRRESLERRVAEGEREAFRMELELIDDAVGRELFELRRRLALVKQLTAR